MLNSNSNNNILFSDLTGLFTLIGIGYSVGLLVFIISVVF